MSDDAIELDARRGMAAQKATVIRRELHDVQADQAALRDRQDALEQQLAAAPATSWSEAAAKIRYILQLYAATQEAQDPRRKRLIASVLEDLDTLPG